MNNVKPTILLILDGFGASPVEQGNAVLNTKMPNYEQLLAKFPKALLHASASEVGLESGEVGNSEVGHLNLGTGRIIMQDLTRINQSINDGSFFENKAINNACDFTIKNNSTLHLIGLLSNGGVHSHINHLLALLDLAKKKNLKEVSIHIITDGRDTPSKSAMSYIDILENKIKKIGIGKISTISGRYYSMDRDNNWDRIEKSYNVLTKQTNSNFNNSKEVIEFEYNSGKSDENITPTYLNGGKLIKDKDSVIFYNFRQDRASQLASCFVEEKFDKFSRGSKKNIFFCGFVSYGDEPSIMSQIAFFQNKINNQLGKIISDNNLTQLHAAETEKYAHVTYFFNGGEEKEFPGENRILIPSPKVDSYDKIPQMSISELTDKFIYNISQSIPHFSVINFANPDMVGHTGNLDATKKSLEYVDINIGKIFNIVKKVNANLIIVADHGNSEQMINPYDQSIDKNHTTNPVPMVIVDFDKQLSDNNTFSFDDKMNFFATTPVGVIADITPTVLDLMNVNIPDEITGQSLKELL